MVGDLNHKWKGDNAGYAPIHQWVIYWKGSPKFCEACGSKTKKRYEWANIDHSYRRVLSEYIGLCHKCHYYFDVNRGLRKALKGSGSNGYKQKK